MHRQPPPTWCTVLLAVGSVVALVLAIVAVAVLAVLAAGG